MINRRTNKEVLIRVEYKYIKEFSLLFFFVFEVHIAGHPCVRTLSFLYFLYLFSVYFSPMHFLLRTQVYRVAYNHAIFPSPLVSFSRPRWTRAIVLENRAQRFTVTTYIVFSNNGILLPPSAPFSPLFATLSVPLFKTTLSVLINRDNRLPASIPCFTIHALSFQLYLSFWHVSFN